jgi:hypothetical protein
MSIYPYPLMVGSFMHAIVNNRPYCAYYHGYKNNKTNDERIDLNLNPKHETKKLKRTQRLKPKT